MTAERPVLLGVRHHGPGSARAVRRALVAYRPRAVLIEGPPEAEPLIELAGDEEMRAPVALLAYPASLPPAAPGRRTPAVFWPFAEFSPEWQAIRWAVANEVPVKFIDLPAAVRLATEPRAGATVDPIASLAAAAGYDDPERWWEDAVEHRGGAEAPGGAELAAALAGFEAIAEAMREVRAAAELASGQRLGSADPDGPAEAERLDEARREAQMRIAIRAALREHERVAVVCGAWHVPALTAPFPSASSDAALLRGLPKIRPAMAWVPWTYARLASWQGYGAGVASPGWYHHLFTAPDRPIARWMVKAAGVLRSDDVPVSSGHVIEAIRLAEALAALRGRPLAGLAEVTDAALAALCDGDELRLALINRRLVVGERLGAVPGRSPAVPLARDVLASQRSLRLPPDPNPRHIDLDLRRDVDARRSRLLHRLRLLGIDWGDPLPARRGLGTFWESWRLAWQPEFAVDLVAAGGYGTTVPDAATALVTELAAKAETLADVTSLVERCLLADLAAALPGVLVALDERIALDHDVAHLMAALPPLARTLRYGDVRGTDASALHQVASGLVTRISVGLPSVVLGLDDTAAATARDLIDGVHASVGPLEEASQPANPTGGPSEQWLAALASLATSDSLPGLLAGRINRLLLDAGRLAEAEASRRMALTLTIGVPARRAAAWVEGFLTGDGVLLVHDERLLRLVDRWLTGIPADAFVEVLPLLRRTFSEYSSPSRRMIGERAARLGPGGAEPGRTSIGEADDEDRFDPERGALALATVTRLLGWDR